MLVLGIACVLAGSLLLAWELRAVAQQLGKVLRKRLRTRWGETSPERVDRWIFYVLVFVLFSISFFVLWQAF